MSVQRQEAEKATGGGRLLCFRFAVTASQPCSPGSSSYLRNLRRRRIGSIASPSGPKSISVLGSGTGPKTTA